MHTTIRRALARAHSFALGNSTSTAMSQSFISKVKHVSLVSDSADPENYLNQFRPQDLGSSLTDVAHLEILIYKCRGALVRWLLVTSVNGRTK